MLKKTKKNLRIAGLLLALSFPLLLSGCEQKTPTAEEAELGKKLIDQAKEVTSQQQDAADAANQLLDNLPGE